MRAAQAGRAGGLHGHPQRLPDRDHRRPHVQPAPARRAPTGVRVPAAPGPGVFDLTPDRGRADARRRRQRVRRRGAAAGGRPGRRRLRGPGRGAHGRPGDRAADPRACPSRSAASPRSARPWPGRWSPRRSRTGDMGLAVAALGARRGRHRARRSGAPSSSRRPTSRRSPATTSRPRRWPSTSPPSLFDVLAPTTTARRDGDGFVLDGVKSQVPRGADAELFVVGALLDGAPALFLVESRHRRAHGRGRPGHGACARPR